MVERIKAGVPHVFLLMRPQKKESEKVEAEGKNRILDQ